MFSPLLMTIPFIQHTDGARLMMSLSHHKQALPLVNNNVISNEVPLIRTDFTIQSDFYIKKANGPGTVRLLDQKIFVEYDDGSFDLIDVYNYFDILVEDNQRVNKGDILLKHQMYDQQNVLKYGIHLNSVFGVLKHTFEDAIFVSESAAEKLTSVHYDIEEYSVGKTFDINTDVLESKVVKKGDWIIKEYSKPSNVLSGGRTIYAEEDCEVISIDVQISEKINVTSKVRKFLDKYNVDNEIANIKKVVKNVSLAKLKKVYLESDNKAVFIRIVYRYTKKLEEGDKLVNRYGNKGVVSCILPDDLFKKEFNFKFPSFYTPEIAFNPLGVHTRLNPSQLGELHLNYILKYTVPFMIKAMIKKNVEIDKIFKFILNKVYKPLGINIEEYEKILQLLKHQQKLKIINDIIKNGLQVILPTIGDKYLLRVYNLIRQLDPNYFKSIDPETGLGFGVFYIMKLEHQVYKKISSVSTSVYNTKAVPINGQKMGEMEMWALIAHDVPSTLYSSQKVKSDEQHSKNVTYERIVHNGVASVKDVPDNEPTSKKIINHLLKIIKIDL